MSAAAGARPEHAGPVAQTAARVEAWIDGHPERWQVAAPLLVFLARADERDYVFELARRALPGTTSARWGIGLQALAYLAGRGGP